MRYRTVSSLSCIFRKGSTSKLSACGPIHVVIPGVVLTGFYGRVHAEFPERVGGKHSHVPEVDIAFRPTAAYPELMREAEQAVHDPSQDRYMRKAIAGGNLQ